MKCRAMQPARSEDEDTELADREALRQAVTPLLTLMRLFGLYFTADSSGKQH